jgi:hypothetical protein
VRGCATSHDMGYMCKIEGKMTQAMCLSILQDGVVKTIEWYPFSYCATFQHDNDRKYTTMLVQQ